MQTYGIQIWGPKNRDWNVDFFLIHDILKRGLDRFSLSEEVLVQKTVSWNLLLRLRES
jgi:hypothetical protein